MNDERGERVTLDHFVGMHTLEWIIRMTERTPVHIGIDGDAFVFVADAGYAGSQRLRYSDEIPSWLERINRLLLSPPSVTSPYLPSRREARRGYIIDDDFEQPIVFEGRRCHLPERDTLAMIDEKTGLVLLEIGTESEIVKTPDWVMSDRPEHEVLLRFVFKRDLDGFMPSWLEPEEIDPPVEIASRKVTDYSRKQNFLPRAVVDHAALLRERRLRRARRKRNIGLPWSKGDGD